MFLFLLFSSLFFWLITIFQSTVMPWWSGDWVFVAIIAWSFYFWKIRQFRKIDYWVFWFPIVLGIGMASFLFYDLLIIVPYLISIVILSIIIFRKKVWVNRWKESVSCYLISFLVYLVCGTIIRKIMNLSLTETDLIIRNLMTLVVGMFFMYWIVSVNENNKVR